MPGVSLPGSFQPYPGSGKEEKTKKASEVGYSLFSSFPDPGETRKESRKRSGATNASVYPGDPGDLPSELEGPRHDPVSELLALQVALVHGRGAMRALYTAGLRPEHMHVLNNRELLAGMYASATADPARWDRGRAARIEAVREAAPDVPDWWIDTIVRSRTVAAETPEHAGSYALRVIAFDAVARAEGALRAALWALEDADGVTALELLKTAVEAAGGRWGDAG